MRLLADVDVSCRNQHKRSTHKHGTGQQHNVGSTCTIQKRRERRVQLQQQANPRDETANHTTATKQGNKWWGERSTRAATNVPMRCFPAAWMLRTSTNSEVSLPPSLFLSLPPLLCWTLSRRPSSSDCSSLSEPELDNPSGMTGTDGETSPGASSELVSPRATKECSCETTVDRL